MSFAFKKNKQTSILGLLGPGIHDLLNLGEVSRLILSTYMQLAFCFFVFFFF